MPKRAKGERWNENGTASVVMLRPMLMCARAKGIDVERILGDIGVPESSLDDFDRRIPEESRCRAWSLATDQAKDAFFGLHVAEHATLGVFDALDYAQYFSDRLGDAFDRIIRFQRVLCDAWTLKLALDGSVARLWRAKKTPRHEAEAFLAVLVRRARELTGDAFVPHEIRFPHATPADTTGYASAFHAPVRFGCPSSEIVFDAKDLDVPIRTSNPGVERVLERYLNDLLTRLPKSEAYVERVRHVAQGLLAGRPTLSAIARKLHASPRTVQRRLREHGTSHATVVESVRRELAERLVAEGRVSITEIAFLLGFADAGSFRRVYKRWAGVTPSHARLRA